MRPISEYPELDTFAKMLKVVKNTFIHIFPALPGCKMARVELQASWFFLSKILWLVALNQAHAEIGAVQAEANTLRFGEEHI